MTSVDPSNTARCPRGRRCESCGSEGGRLTVQTVSIARLGVMCLTLCGRCAGSGVVPPVAVATAVRLVGQHSVHLGTDLDEAAAIQDD